MDPDKTGPSEADTDDQGLGSSFALIGKTALSLLEGAGRLPLALTRTAVDAAGTTSTAVARATSRATSASRLSKAYMLGGAALALSTVAGVFGPSTSKAVEALSVGGLRALWAVAVFWMANRILRPSPAQSLSLRTDLALSMVLFAAAQTAPLGFLMTIAWSLWILVRLKVLDFPRKDRAAFVAASLGAALLSVLVRWIGEYALIGLLLIGG